MSILKECKKLLEGLSIPAETSVFEGTAPETYVVILPLTDTFELHADNTPGLEVQEVRLSLFCKGNYIKIKNSIVRGLLASDFTITDRGTSSVKTTPGTIITPLTWQNIMNWRNEYGYNWS